MPPANRLIVARHDNPKLVSSIITLLIGKENVRYTVHGKTLFERSEGMFDESVLSVSGDERSVALPSITKSGCELYLHYIQVGNFPLDQFKPRIRERCQHREEISVALIELYSMSTTFYAEQTMDAAASGLAEIFSVPGQAATVIPGAASVTKAYAVTKSGSKLRRLMVDLYMRNARGARVDSHWPRQFVIDLAGAALKTVGDMERGQGLHKPALDQCLYHEHIVRERCPRHATKTLSSTCFLAQSRWRPSPLCPLALSLSMPILQAWLDSLK
ncbi:hypothetical protein BST61_g5939 [Cercospora zeina]